MCSLPTVFERCKYYSDLACAASRESSLYHPCQKLQTPARIFSHLAKSTLTGGMKYIVVIPQFVRLYEELKLKLVDYLLVQADKSWYNLRNANTVIHIPEILKHYHTYIIFARMTLSKPWWRIKILNEFVAKVTSGSKPRPGPSCSS